MIRVLCPRGHLIATVALTDRGAIIPKGRHHGLTFDYAAPQNLTRIRARCSKKRCGYDGSADYGVLRDALLAAAAAPSAGRHAEFQLTH